MILILNNEDIYVNITKRFRYQCLLIPFENIQYMLLLGAAEHICLESEAILLPMKDLKLKLIDLVIELNTSDEKALLLFLNRKSITIIPVIRTAEYIETSFQVDS